MGNVVFMTNEQEAYFDAVMSDDLHILERMRALGELTDQDLLKRVILECPDGAIRWAALEELKTDQEFLQGVALSDPDLAVRSEAGLRITSASVLMAIWEEHQGRSWTLVEGQYWVEDQNDVGGPLQSQPYLDPQMEALGLFAQRIQKLGLDEGDVVLDEMELKHPTRVDRDEIFETLRETLVDKRGGQGPNQQSARS